MLHIYLRYLHNYTILTPYLGLPVPIVAIAAGIANEHYGSDNGLAHILHIHT